MNDHPLHEQNEKVRELVRSLDEREQGHSDRVAVFATATGEKMGLDDDALRELRWAAALHDIGKISLDKALFNSTGPLTNNDLDALREHAVMARGVLESLEWLQPAIPMIRHHHERWDGGGYPDKLAQENIPLGARIISVAEAFDVLTGGLSYRAPLTEEQALGELQRCAGSQFDPGVVQAFATVQPLIQPIQQ